MSQPTLSRYFKRASPSSAAASEPAGQKRRIEPQHESPPVRPPASAIHTPRSPAAGLLHAGADPLTASAPRRQSATSASSAGCARDPAACASAAPAPRSAADEPSAAGDASALPLDVGAVAAVVGLRNLSELERQVVQLKAEAGPSLLLVEVGYKILSFGEDAAALAPVLHMCTFRRGHFLVAAFPLVRLEVHLLRLLHAGFRVSVARQTETAAQKAVGGAPHTGFARSLHSTFTLATYAPAAPVENSGGGLSGGLSAHPAPRWLVSIHESPAARSRAHGGTGVPTLHVLAVDVASENVLYEEQAGQVERSDHPSWLSPHSTHGLPASDETQTGRSPPNLTAGRAPFISGRAPIISGRAPFINRNAELAVRDGAHPEVPAVADAPRLLLAHMLEALSPVEIVVPHHPSLSPRIARELAAYAPMGRTPSASVGNSTHVACCTNNYPACRSGSTCSATTPGAAVNAPTISEYGFAAAFDVQPALRLDREEEDAFTVETAAAIVASSDPSGLSALLAAPPGLARALGSVSRRLHLAGHASLLARAPQTYEPFSSHGCMRLGSGVLTDLHVLSPDGHSLLSTLLSASPNTTPAAGRLLRRWLAAPLACLAAISARHSAVEELRAVTSEIAAPRNSRRAAIEIAAPRNSRRAATGIAGASEIAAAPRHLCKSSAVKSNDGGAGGSEGGTGGGGSGAALAVCRRLRARVPAHDLEAHLARLARGEGAPWQLLALCDTVGGALDEMTTLRQPESPLLRSLLTPHQQLRSFISEWCQHLTPAAAAHSVTLVAAFIPKGNARTSCADAAPSADAGSAEGMDIDSASSMGDARFDPASASSVVTVPFGGMPETGENSSPGPSFSPAAPATADDVDDAAAAARARLYAAHARVGEVERHLETHELSQIRRLLGDQTLRFKHQSAGTSGREEYFIELSHGSNAARRVPKEWLRVGQTKTVVRFRPQSVAEQMRTLALAREVRETEAKSAWLALQRAAAPWMQALRGLVGRLAQLDALLCLAGLARRHGYVRPTLMAADGAPATLHATEGRHPLIEAYRGANGLTYVPNDVRLGGSDNCDIAEATVGDIRPLMAPNRSPSAEPPPSATKSSRSGSSAPPRCAILMGPNMGGKSSYCRQVGTLALLAQVGSFVPAERCTLTPFRWLATRMGARDCLARGVSTFELELAQTAEALSLADRRGRVSWNDKGGERRLRAAGGESTAEALSFADGRGRASGSESNGGGDGERRLRAGGGDSPSPSHSLLLLDESASGNYGAGDCRQRAGGGDFTPPSRSLLLLDEVGRGTATHDGAAIAHAVLQHIADSGALCVFTTHYPEVADLAAARPKDVAVFHMDAIIGSSAPNGGGSHIHYPEVADLAAARPKDVAVFHMDAIVDCSANGGGSEGPDLSGGIDVSAREAVLNAESTSGPYASGGGNAGTDAVVPDVRMLHRLAPGTGDGSYGIHVGRLAGLPPSVLAAAAAESEQMRRRLRAEAAKRKEVELQGLIMHAVAMAREGIGGKELSELQQEMRFALRE